MCVNNVKNYLKKCSSCNDSGTITGIGGIRSNCSKCKFKRALVNFFEKFWAFIINKPIQKYPVGFTIVVFLFYYFISKNFSELMRASSIIGLLGLLFAALKYKLDQANYHKSLFDERYKLFCQIEEVIRRANALDATDEGLRMIDEIINRCQFLFGKITLEFIIEIRSNFIQLICLKKSNKNSAPEADKAMEFFASLITLRSLPSKF
ncbi:TPA: hypothetical protein ACF2P6_002998, partial [Legionella pneumophila]